MVRKYLYGGPGYFLGGVTAKNLDEGTKKVARGFNWLMGKAGDAFNTVVTAGASSDFGQTSPFALMDRKTIAKGREQVRQKAKKAIEENAVYVSPSSHIAAWTQGSWDPKVGALFLASDPRLQALGVVGDLAALKYTPKAVKVGKNLSLILKKRSVISKVNKELKKGIKENSILESYNEVPANKDIGTAYDYLDFLDNIYPNSKLNATFYHGGPKGILKFKSAKLLGKTNKGINSATKDYGIYLADDKSLAQYYAETNKKANRHLYNVRVNVQNPMRYETNNWYMDKMSTTGDLRFRPGEITLKWYDKLSLKDYDGIYHTKSKNAFDNGELVMLDGDNIHIMGTPEESLMFRNWKLNPLYSSKSLLEEIPLTPEQYEKSFLNYAKAAKPGLFFAGLAATPPALIWYNNYLKSKRANARKWKHEDGGRVKKHLAFVNGVSILDSNPDAYKYVKKKIKKAATGGNSKNWFSGVGNWINKNLNTISTIGSTIMNGVGLLKQNSELSKAKAAKEKELNAKYNPNNLINDSEIWNEVNNQINLLELLNPDVHYGDIDKLNLYKKIKNSYLSQARLYTEAAKLLELLLYNLYISDAQTGNTSSLMDLIGNGISTGIGMLGNKGTTSTSSVPTGTTTTSYSSYAPGYTPSLPKTFSEYAALNYKK